MGWVRGEVLGRGGFGTVHLAMVQGDLRRETRSEVMAVKSSPLTESASLSHERQVLDRLAGSPEIVACYGDDVTIEPDGRQLYNLWLEYVSGGSLLGLCCGKPMAEADVRRYTGCILRGLRSIHAAGYVHCDIKPDNILVTSDGQAKIADFGLAKRVGVRLGCGNLSLRGTLLYMAPESVSTGEYEPPVDVWALGCVVSEMATGIVAWLYGQEGDDEYIASCRRLVRDEEEHPEIPDELSEEGRDFLRRCFVRDTRERWTVDMLLAHPFVTAAEENRGSEGPTSLCSSSPELCDLLRLVHTQPLGLESDSCHGEDYRVMSGCGDWVLAGLDYTSGHRLLQEMSLTLPLVRQGSSYRCSPYVAGFQDGWRSQERIISCQRSACVASLPPTPMCRFCH